MNVRSGWTRRGALGAAAALALARLSDPGYGAENPTSLVYSTYGGDYGQWVKNAFEKPFTAATGIDLVHDIGENPQRFAKLQTFKNRPKFQFIGLQDRYLFEAARDGLIEQIDYSKVPYAKAIPTICKKSAWVGYSSSSIGIIYNTERVKTPPRNWSDVLDDRYKGRIFIDDFNHFGLHVVLAIAMAKGGGYADIKPGLDMIRDIKERLNPRFISTSQEGMKLLGDGEVDIAMWQSSRAFLLKRAGKPIDYVVPQTGDVPVFYGNGIVKGAGADKWGHMLLDIFCDPKREADFCAGPLPSTPANPDTFKFLPPETAKLIARPAGAKQIELDYGEILPRLDGWTKDWNKMIAG